MRPPWLRLSLSWTSFALFVQSGIRAMHQGSRAKNDRTKALRSTFNFSLGRDVADRGAFYAPYAVSSSI